jgi:hypothetical protein
MSEIEELTNFDIEELCQKLKLPLLQVCSKNKLIVRPYRRKSCYVINMDDENGGGTHWVAIYSSHSNGFYFDSFATMPPKNIINFFKRYKIKWNYNRQQIQDLSSSACGYFCVYFLYFMYKNDNQKKDLKYICFKMIEPFNTDDQTNNDKVLQKHITHIFK